MIFFTDLLKRVLTIYSRNFTAVFILLLPTLIWNIAISFIPPDFMTNARFIVPTLVISIIISAFTELLLIGGFSKLLQGEDMDHKMIFPHAGKNLPWFVLLLVLWFLSIFIGALFLLVPGIIFATWFMFLGTVLMLEGKRGMNVFRRSKQLVSGYFFPLLWREAGVILLTIIIVSAANQGLNAILNFIALPAIIPYIAIINTLFGVTLSALFLPIVTGATVTLYLEVRRLKE